MQRVLVALLAGLLAGCAGGAPAAGGVDEDSSSASTPDASQGGARATTQGQSSSSNPSKGTTAPGPSTSSATSQGAPAAPRTVALEGDMAYQADLVVAPCGSPVPAGVSSVSIGWRPAELGLDGAAEVNLTLEWTPDGAVNQVLKFEVSETDKGPPPPGNPLLQTEGASPLQWTWTAADLKGMPDEVRLWVVGPSCQGVASPGAEPLVSQTVTFRGLVTLA